MFPNINHSPEFGRPQVTTDNITEDLLKRRNVMDFKILRSLRILTFILVLAIGLTGLVGNAPALAITNGQADGDSHPYVCIVVMFDENYQFTGSASGILISPNVVLTAGHVAGTGSYAFVSFSPEVQYGDLTGYVIGMPFVHPQYQFGYGQGLPGSITHDVGVIILSEPVVMSEYGILPNERAIDELAQKTPVDIVGYGYNYRERPSGDWIFLNERYHALSELITSKNKQSDEFIKLTSNPAQGKGGSSFGDSGGPILLRDTNIILGLVSYGTNYNCTGVEYAARIDREDILEWILGWLP